MNRIINVASVLCLTLIALLALLWIVTGRENALLEVAFGAIFLAVQAQHALSELTRGGEE